jgi:hypothetical protein
MATIEQRKSINTFVAKQHFALNVALRHMPNHAPSQRDSTVKEKKKKKKKKKFKNIGLWQTTTARTSERTLCGRQEAIKSNCVIRSRQATAAASDSPHADEPTKTFNGSAIN